MLSTPHLLVGAAIAKAVPNPFISIPAAFASHFLLDIVPHWDGAPRPPFGKLFYLLVSLDYLFGLSLIWWFIRDNPNPAIFFIAGFAATAPDFLMGTYRNFDLPWNKWGWYKAFNEFHRSIQNNLKVAPGLATSLVASAIAIFIILRGVGF